MIRVRRDDTGREGEWALRAASGGGRLVLAHKSGWNHVFVRSLELDWWRPDAEDVGCGLLAAARADVPEGLTGLSYFLDEPDPRHDEPARRRVLLERAGFRVVRDGRRWRWAGGPAPARSRRLAFRSLADVGDEAFVDAIARVSEDTLDARLRANRERLGRDGDASAHFGLLRRLRHRSEWFLLGYDETELVGLFAGAGDADAVFVAYVGVVPERRGRGFVDDLLRTGTAVLLEAGEERIEADTDKANVPMQRAFERSGYVSDTTRLELVADREPRSH
ncbi:MAG TPA: GNAT family N-acetyltransferase [Gaiellaceae bacterium]